MRTIGYINWKGGVGKTTLAINTAYALGEYLDKLRVLFIDTDKQGNASTWFDADPERPTLTDILRRAEPIEKVIQPTRYEHIDLIAADASLLDINIEILRDPKGANHPRGRFLSRGRFFHTCPQTTPEVGFIRLPER